MWLNRDMKLSAYINEKKGEEIVKKEKLIGLLQNLSVDLQEILKLPAL